MIAEKVDAHQFYGEYHGHKVNHLSVLYPHVRESSDSILWTAGDSSLDNKFWFRDKRPAVGAYKNVLQPPYSNADVTYWLNYLCDVGGGSGSTTRQREGGVSGRNRWAAINTAGKVRPEHQPPLVSMRPSHLPSNCFDSCSGRCNATDFIVYVPSVFFANLHILLYPTPEI